MKLPKFEIDFHLLGLDNNTKEILKNFERDLLSLQNQMQNRSDDSRLRAIQELIRLYVEDFGSQCEYDLIGLMKSIVDRTLIIKES